MIGTRRSGWQGKTIIRNTFIVLIICAIGGYAGFQSKKIISGPQITIQSPATTSADASAVDVTGIVKNVSVVTLNDRQIPIDEAGQFKEKVLLYDGNNHIKLEATDRFGAHVTKELQVVYTSKSDAVGTSGASGTFGATNSTTSLSMLEAKSDAKIVENKLSDKSTTRIDSKSKNATSTGSSSQSSTRS